MWHFIYDSNLSFTYYTFKVETGLGAWLTATFLQHLVYAFGTSSHCLCLKRLRGFPFIISDPTSDSLYFFLLVLILWWHLVKLKIRNKNSKADQHYHSLTRSLSYESQRLRFDQHDTWTQPGHFGSQFSSCNQFAFSKKAEDLCSHKKCYINFTIILLSCQLSFKIFFYSIWKLLSSLICS